jgi:hypothetical protein
MQPNSPTCDHPQLNHTPETLCALLGLNPETLRNWSIEFVLNGINDGGIPIEHIQSALLESHQNRAA